MLCLAAALACLGGAAQAAGSLNVIVENDSFIDQSDRHYTSGLYGSWTSDALAPGDADSHAALADAILLLPARGGQAAYRHGLFFGQDMFTPANLFPATPNPLDRPYAGWLYFGARLYRESGDVLDRAEVALGVVGPAAGAGSVQEWWHAIGLFGGVHPNGWSHQLRDEPGIVLTEQRTWRYWTDLGPVEAEALPEVGVSVGNIFTYAAAGGTLRIGHNLHADWGPGRVQPALTGADFVDDARLGDFGWYAFVGIEGRAVARNVFLDGSSFQASPHVSKNIGVADFDAGLAFLWPGVRLMTSFTERSEEFSTQTGGDDRFLSVELSFAH